MLSASKLLAAGAALVMVAVSPGTALADPPGPPRATDVVGVGSDTIQYLLDQFSYDYNRTHLTAPSLLYSFDATNPQTGQPGDPIVTKAGCNAIPRPDGSSDGILALEQNVTDPASPGAYCIDFAGSSRGDQANDPGCVPGGICFIELAGDALTWAVRDAASGGTDAPASLTLAQLKNIYLCNVTNWAQVGGQNAPIQPFLPQPSSGTTTSWLVALGGGVNPIVPGPCVSDLGHTLQDNQGINPALNTPEAIVPYSVADYVAQVYRDAPCLHASCTGSPPCQPATGQNRFGCDEHGVLGLGKIGGSKPITPWPPPPPPCATCKINAAFAPAFQRIVSVVVRYAATPDNIPPYLEPFFAAGTANPPGWTCTSSTAIRDTKNYGFLTLTGPLITGTGCGTPHGW